jgi:hypothetical protein
MPGEGAVGTVKVPKTAAEKNSEKESKVRWELFNQQKLRIWEDMQSGSDSYDQSLLTLSSGALGLSIAFIKDIVKLQDAMYLPLLYFSWVAFGCCILITVVSFQISKLAQMEQLENSRLYYLERKDENLNKRGKWAVALDGCTIGAGVLFVVALACTITFAIVNVKRRSQMPDTPVTTRLQEGRSGVSMTQVPQSPDQRGRPPVEMTKVPPQPVPIQPATVPSQPKKD